MQPIKCWPAAERPREKLLAKGARALSDAELLAIFLRTGVAGQNAVELARQLLQQCGSLTALINLSCVDFCRLHGVGQASYILLQAAQELSCRLLEQQWQQQPAFTSTRQSRDFVQQLLQHEAREHFLVLLLDNQHCLLHQQILFSGTINAATVHPREVVRLALRYNAAAVIVAHNHPSGSARPSQADIAITRQLAQALKLVEIVLLDHLVVGRGAVTSLAEAGLM